MNFPTFFSRQIYQLLFLDRWVRSFHCGFRLTAKSGICRSRGCAVCLLRVIEIVSVDSCLLVLFFQTVTTKTFFLLFSELISNFVVNYNPLF